MGFKVNVETPEGIRAFGVLLGATGRSWRARIITRPNVLWATPGGGGSMKFLGPTSEDVEQQAVSYIREHCASRGYTMRDQPQLVELEIRNPRALDDRAARFARILPVRYGISKPTLYGRTGNLSSTGLFVHTKLPIAKGGAAGLMLELEHYKLPMQGTVAWSRSVPGPSQPVGMGLQLLTPPEMYLHYIRALSVGTDESGMPCEELDDPVAAVTLPRRPWPRN